LDCNHLGYGIAGNQNLTQGLVLNTFENWNWIKIFFLNNLILGLNEFWALRKLKFLFHFSKSLSFFVTFFMFLVSSSFHVEKKVVSFPRFL
jgi:hypothetical protein